MMPTMNIDDKHNLLCILIRAESIKDVAVLGRQDPYAVLRICGQKYKSKVCHDGHTHPVWQQHILITEVELNALLKIEIYKLNIFNDTLICSGNLPLNPKLLTGSPIPVPLATPSNKKSGCLWLTLQIINSNQLPLNKSLSFSNSDAPLTAPLPPQSYSIASNPIGNRIPRDAPSTDQQQLQQQYYQQPQAHHHQGQTSHSNSSLQTLIPSHLSASSSQLTDSGNSTASNGVASYDAAANVYNAMVSAARSGSLQPSSSYITASQGSAAAAQDAEASSTHSTAASQGAASPFAPYTALQQTFSAQVPAYTTPQYSMPSAGMATSAQLNIPTSTQLDRLTSTTPAASTQLSSSLPAPQPSITAAAAAAAAAADMTSRQSPPSPPPPSSSQQQDMPSHAPAAASSLPAGLSCDMQQAGAVQQLPQQEEQQQEEQDQHQQGRSPAPALVHPLVSRRKLKVQAAPIWHQQQPQRPELQPLQEQEQQQPAAAAVPAAGGQPPAPAPAPPPVHPMASRRTKARPPAAPIFQGPADLMASHRGGAPAAQPAPGTRPPAPPAPAAPAPAAPALAPINSTGPHLVAYTRPTAAAPAAPAAPPLQPAPATTLPVNPPAAPQLTAYARTQATPQLIAYTRTPTSTTPPTPPPTSTPKPTPSTTPYQQQQQQQQQESTPAPTSTTLQWVSGDKPGGAASRRQAGAAGLGPRVPGASRRPGAAAPVLVSFSARPSRRPPKSSLMPTAIIPKWPCDWIFESKRSKDVHTEYQLFPGRPLGSGSYGKVFMARRRKDALMVACKIIAKANIKSQLELEDILHEVQIMHHLSSGECRNIVRLYDVYEDLHVVYLMLELCTGKDLMEHVKRKQRYSERDAADVARALVSTIAYCHQNGVVHRDLKLENLLMSDATDRAVLKVTDFGLSTFVQGDHEVLKDHVGSAWYIAPEVLRGAYNKQADLWSCGVILFILLCGMPPFDGSSEEEVYYAVRYSPPPMSAGPWERVSTAGRDCVARMLAKDPHKRVTAQQILAHPWLGGGAAPCQPLALRFEVLERMKQYTETNKLQKAVMKVIARNLPPEEIEGLRAQFKSIDTDNSGTITCDELRAFLRRKHSWIPESELQYLMSHADGDGDGEIDYEEFLAATISQTKLLSGDSLRMAFRSFDRYGAGHISRDDLKHVLRSMRLEHGDLLTDAEIEDLMSQLDTDGDGRISYEEFCAGMQVRY